MRKRQRPVLVHFSDAEKADLKFLAFQNEATQAATLRTLVRQAAAKLRAQLAKEAAA